MDQRRQRRVDAVIALGLGLVALLVYACTAAVGAYPGIFSTILLQGAGILPALTPDYPLWNLVMQLMRHLPLGADLSVPLNAFSVLMGACCVGLFYRVVNLLVRGAIIEDEDDAAFIHQLRAARIAGVVAALALAFCMPFWVVANRCHWAPFHLALFLVTVRVWCAAVFGHSRAAEPAFGLLLGLSIVEHPTMVIFAPLLAGSYWVMLWKQERAEWRHWLPVLGALVLGLLAYLPAAWFYMRSEGFALRGYSGLFDVLWTHWHDQWYLLSRSLPSQGWLVVLVVTAVPACTAMLVARRSLNDDSDWTYYLLHVVLTALAVAVLLNLPFAPWRLLGFNRILVMPYLLLAGLFGYVAAYWYLLPRRRKPDHPSFLLRLACGATTLLAAGALLVTLAAAVRNYPQADARSSRLIRQLAAETVLSLDGRPWLVTDGSLDAALLIEARRLGRDLRVIDLTTDRKPFMNLWVASMFEGPRMQNLVKLGVPTLVREWLEDWPEAAAKVAVMPSPDFWVGAGYEAAPHLALFLGERGEARTADAAAIMDAHRAFWRRLQSYRLTDPTLRMGPLESYRRHLRRHLGLVANNLGVYMEDLGREADAFEAYGVARDLDPDNVCALMNQYTLVQHGFATPEADAVRTKLDGLAAAFKANPPPVAMLTARFGYVRSPRAFAGLGISWAAAGEDELAASGLRRAMGLAPSAGRAGIKTSLANLYLLQDRPRESEALYYELLVENPAHQGALLGMARIELDRGQPDKAREYLQRAETAGVPEVLMQLEWAAYRMATADTSGAEAILLKRVEEQPDLVRAWAMLVTIHAQARDRLKLYDDIRRIGRIKHGHEFLLAMASGYLAILQDDLNAAAVAFEKALAMHPDDTRVLEYLVRLDLMQGRQDQVQGRILRLLRLDPANAFGNFVLGGLQIGRREFALARDSLTRSLETEKTPEALNDLAWLLQESGLFAEAEQHARDALALRAELPAAWDTLGVILMKTDRFEEAHAAFEKALAGEAGSIPATLHLAELALRQDRKQEAAMWLENLAARRQDLSTVDLAEFERLRGQL